MDKEEVMVDEVLRAGQGQIREVEGEGPCRWSRWRVQFPE